MSTKPHTPNVDDMRAAWVDYSTVSALASPVAEFDRFIAKVKADALRDAAGIAMEHGRGGLIASDAIIRRAREIEEEA